MNTVVCPNCGRWYEYGKKEDAPKGCEGCGRRFDVEHEEYIPVEDDGLCATCNHTVGQHNGDEGWCGQTNCFCSGFLKKGQ